ncbi:hypothetical protein GGR50DRAFT_502673 [Xylaria sp. CBS 124048]|nr:hypothetical protein GGR50DRAFT_502673 [Xylaria sp. CBS 124048]
MSPNAGRVPVNPSDLGLGPAIMGVTWTLTALCIICVFFRFYIRSRRPSRLGWDDWAILIALIIQIVDQVFVTIAFHYGAGKHDRDITEQQAISITKWFWITSAPSILISVVARISAALLLFRIFRSVSWFKWFLIIFTILQTLVGVVAIAAIYTQAEPISVLWDPYVKPIRVKNPHFKIIIVSISQALFAFSDLAYVFMPVCIIWKLKMPLHQKVGLIFVLSLSLISFVGSVMKPVTTAKAHSVYPESVVILWAGLEQGLVIIINCIPALRAIKLMEQPFIRSIGSSLVSILSPSSRKSTMATSPTLRNGWEEIGVTGNVAHRKSLGSSATAIAKGENHSSHSEELGPYIHRTDQFSVSYKVEKPAENV